MLGDMPIDAIQKLVLEQGGDKLDLANEGLTNLVYWYPILEEIGMRVPKTIIVHRGPCKLGHFIDGKVPEGFDQFEARLRAAMKEIGWPCFLRTGMTSDKHSWKDTCFVAEEERGFANRVARLVEVSYMANIAGRPFNFDFWAVREMIPTSPVVTYFNEMPIAMEVRAFIRDGEIQCLHPYWPKEAFENASEDVKEKIKGLGLHTIPEEEQKELVNMIHYIAQYFPGYWSTDMLRDKDGNWWCTDMAQGNRSYHFPQCEHAPKKDV